MTNMRSGGSMSRGKQVGELVQVISTRCVKEGILNLSTGNLGHSWLFRWARSLAGKLRRKHHQEEFPLTKLLMQGLRGNEKVSTDPDFKGLVDFMHSDDTAFMNVGINIGYVSSILTLPVLPKIIDDCTAIKTERQKQGDHYLPNHSSPKMIFGNLAYQGLALLGEPARRKRRQEGINTLHHIQFLLLLEPIGFS